MNSLEKWRKEKGLKQRDAAKKLGVSNSAISMYERGERKPLLSIKRHIQRVTMGAVPVESWD